MLLRRRGHARVHAVICANHAQEANAISDEVSKGMLFGVKLMANLHKRARQRAEGGEGEGEDGEGKEDARGEDELDTEVFVRIEFAGGARPVTMWHYDKFMNRLFLMREMYQAFVEAGRDISGTRCVLFVCDCGLFVCVLTLLPPPLLLLLGVACR